MGGFGGAGGDAGGLGNIDFSKLGGLDPSALGAAAGEGGFGADEEGEGEDVWSSISRGVVILEANMINRRRTCPNSKHRRKERRAPRSKKSRNLSQPFSVPRFNDEHEDRKKKTVCFLSWMGSFLANRGLSLWDHMDLRHSPKGSICHD